MVRLKLPKSDAKQLNEEKFILPFDQVGLDKQLDILKSYVTYFTQESKPTGYKEIAPLARISPPMVSGCLRFWVSTGLLQGTGGKYAPVKSLVDFCNKLSWGAEDEAWAILRSALSKTWFVRQTEMGFKVAPQMSEEELIKLLGTTVGKPRSNVILGSLKRIIELLEKTKIVTKADDKYSIDQKTVADQTSKSISVPDENNLITFVVDGEKYAVVSEELKTFIKEKGRSMVNDEYEIE